MKRRLLYNQKPPLPLPPLPPPLLTTHTATWPNTTTWKSLFSAASQFTGDLLPEAGPEPGLSRRSPREEVMSVSNEPPAHTAAASLSVWHYSI